MTEMNPLLEIETETETESKKNENMKNKTLNEKNDIKLGWKEQHIPDLNAWEILDLVMVCIMAFFVRGAVGSILSWFPVYLAIKFNTPVAISTGFLPSLFFNIIIYACYYKKKKQQRKKKQLIKRDCNNNRSVYNYWSVNDT